MIIKQFVSLLLILCKITVEGYEDICPGGCFCDHKKGETLANNQDALRIHCVQMADDKFDPKDLPASTIQLDISKYNLKSVPKSFFSNVKYIEKVDLSSNDIEHVEDDAFVNLSYLRTLDLSQNKIEVITMDTLRGLIKLERLKLSHNLLTTIEFGAFTHLVNIQKIDLAENPLTCDCHLAWILEWMDVAGAKARCSAPQNLSNMMIKKLKTKDMTCDVPMMPNKNTQNTIFKMQIVPSNSQLVFEGDSLRLQCLFGLITNDVLIRWFLNGNLVTHNQASITSLEPKSDINHHSNLFLSSLESDHSGNWTCSALVDTGVVQNLTVSVVVINHATVLCPSTVTNTSKGHYTWGVTVAGLSATNKCLKSSNQKEPAEDSVVEYMCDENGKWGILNDSQCAHTSDVTDKLYRFAHMNNSDFDQITLVQSAKKLLEFTGESGKFLDGMDIVYLSTVLENYVPYLAANHELASLLVDIAYNTMKMNTEVIMQGQLFSHAATRLMATISNISRIVPAFQHHRNYLAVEGFKVSPLSFGGITCSWYSETVHGADRVFYCSENNKTAANIGRYILGSVQLPSTLYYQLELLERDINTAKNIMFSAFSNDTLFPQVTTKDGVQPPYEVISACVMGSAVVAMEPFNLSEPVYVILKLRGDASQESEPTPAWWDPRANNGLGAWQPDYCRMMKARRDSAVFSCNRLGYYALLGDKLARQRTPKSGANHVKKETHPAVYAGTAVAAFCLISSVCIFTHMFTTINMTKKLKHSLPNLWLSVTFLLVFHVMGGELVIDRDYCQSVGLLLHYFTLTSTLWLTISSSIIYRKLSNPTDKPVRHINPYVVTPEEEVYIGVGDGKKYKKPMARFYLVGWGVPLIICGITGGASMSQYSSSGWCFLSLAPAAGAILIPIIISFIIHFFFIFAILTFPPSRIISHVDNIYLSEYRQDSQTSLCSQSTILLADKENSHRSHGFALLAVSLLLLGILFSSFMSIATPLSSLDQETHQNMFGPLYAVLTSILGITVVSYYCLLRHDTPLCSLSYGCSKPDETSNLVNITPNNLSANHKAAKLTNLPQPNILQPVRQPQSFQLIDLGGSVLGPSSGRLKQCNIESEGSSEYHSVNNAAHLRRPLHLQPVTSGRVSEADMTDIMFSSKMKVNNVNIHVSEGPDKVNWVDCPGKEDWSIHSQHSYFGQRPSCTSSPRQLPYPDIAGESTQLLMNNSELLTAGEAAVDDQDLYSKSSNYSLAYRRDHLPATTSLPRRYGRRNKERRQNNNRQQISAYSDIERTEVCSNSKLSEISSSTAYSARSAGSKGRSKRNKPRRKPRKRSEIFPESSFTKRSNTNYDPIMEVSAKADNDETDDNPLLAVEATATIQSDDKQDMLAEAVNTDDDVSSDNIHLVHQLANRELSNKETCV